MTTKEYEKAIWALIREAEEAIEREDHVEFTACLRKMRELTLDWNPLENGQRPNAE